LRLTLGLQLINTPKTRLTFNLNHTQAETTGDNLLLQGSWDISKSFSLYTRATYTLAEKSAYGFETSLTVRL
jgi:hypothetical protein